MTQVDFFPNEGFKNLPSQRTADDVVRVVEYAGDGDE